MSGVLFYQEKENETKNTINNAESVVKSQIGNNKFAVYEFNLTDSLGAEIHQLDGKVELTNKIT